MAPSQAGHSPEVAEHARLLGPQHYFWTPPHTLSCLLLTPHACWGLWTEDQCRCKAWPYVWHLLCPGHSCFSSLSRPSLFQGFYFLYKPFPCNSILWAKNCSCKQKKQNQANQSQKRLKKGSKSIGKSKKINFQNQCYQRGTFQIIKVKPILSKSIIFWSKILIAINIRCSGSVAHPG